MNKKIYFLPLLLLVFIFTACEETTEATKFDNWKPRNEAFMDSLETVYNTQPDHGGLNVLVPTTAPKDLIYYKDITPDGNIVGDKLPKYTDAVKAFYRGTYIFGETFDENFSGANPSVYDSPSSFAVNGNIVAGWSEALQRMKVGERWMVYIPWEMGYGDVANGNIPAYSTLIFDLELYEIIK